MAKSYFNEKGQMQSLKVLPHRPWARQQIIENIVTEKERWRSVSSFRITRKRKWTLHGLNGGPLEMFTSKSFGFINVTLFEKRSSKKE